MSLAVAPVTPATPLVTPVVAAPLVTPGGASDDPSSCSCDPGGSGLVTPVVSAAALVTPAAAILVTPAAAALVTLAAALLTQAAAALVTLLAEPLAEGCENHWVFEPFSSHG